MIAYTYSMVVYSPCVLSVAMCGTKMACSRLAVNLQFNSKLCTYFQIPSIDFMS